MTSGRSDITDVCLELHHVTAKAILVSDGATDSEKVWLPLSQIEFEKNQDGTITVSGPEWLLTDKGLL